MEYVSIIGTGVTGSFGRSGNSAAAAVAASAISAEGEVTEDGSVRGGSDSLGDRFQSLVAFSSYSVLSGEGEGVLGDGECCLPSHLTPRIQSMQH